MHDLPKVVILTHKQTFLDFADEVQPYIRLGQTDASKLVEDLWEGFFYKEGRSASIESTIADMALSSRFRGATRQSRSVAGELLLQMANTIAAQVDSHDLYFGRDYLPYNLAVEGGSLVLRRDDAIERVQQSGGGDETTQDHHSRYR